MGLIVLTFSLVCALTMGYRASSPAEETEKPRWVPLVATYFQEILPDIPGFVPEKVVFAGPYLRDSEGSTYYRLRLVSKPRHLFFWPDSGFLYDRTNDTDFLIDYGTRTAKVLKSELGESSWQGRDLLTRKEFDAHHSSDKFLGKQMIEGFECEGYKLRSTQRNNENGSEIWYVPALNYLALRTKNPKSRVGELKTYIGEIQLDRRPGPEYFHIPENFKIIEKE